MTKQEISPEIALKQIQQRIINVIDSAENFAGTLSHCEDEFKSRAYNSFRENRVSYEGCGWPRCRKYEDVALSTLLSYGVVKVARTEFKEKIVKDYWNNGHNYRINGTSIIDAYAMDTLCHILPNCHELMDIEELDGKPIETKVNYYKIDFARIEQLEVMRHTLASLSE